MADQAIYAPGSWGRLFGKVVNTGPSEVIVDEIGMEFDWGMYSWQKYSMRLPPGSRQNFSVRFQVPPEVIGTYSFRAKAYERYPSYSPPWGVTGAGQLMSWTDPALSLTQDIGCLSVRPFPIYRAFVSRGVSPVETSTVNPIVAMVEDYGFTSHTVGIDIMADFPNLPFQVRNEIRVSDCVIVIATKRDLSAITGRWKTFEWSHGEAGIGFDAEKPILVMSDYEVQLGGLLSSLPQPQVIFDVNNLSALSRDLSRVMPTFRNEIASRKHSEFWGGVARVALPVVGGFLLGAALTSKEK